MSSLGTYFAAEANRKHRERICRGKDEAIRKGKKPSGVGGYNSIRRSRCQDILGRRGPGSDSKAVAMMETAEDRGCKDAGALGRPGWRQVPGAVGRLHA